MRIDYITGEEWALFQERFPLAANFLSNCSLLGEWRHLKGQQLSSLNDWQRQRLRELNRLIEDPPQSHDYDDEGNPRRNGVNP
jgi:hypothetical protein